MGHRFVREVDGIAVEQWYRGLTEEKGLSEGTALRHFNVMHHVMGKAATIWSKETGIDRNPADEVEVKRPNDQRERYLSVEDLRGLKQALHEKMSQRGMEPLNRAYNR